MPWIAKCSGNHSWQQWSLLLLVWGWGHKDFHFIFLLPKFMFVEVRGRKCWIWQQTKSYSILTLYWLYFLFFLLQYSPICLIFLSHAVMAWRFRSPCSKCYTIFWQHPQKQPGAYASCISLFSPREKLLSPITNKLFCDSWEWRACAILNISFQSH